MHKPEKKSRLLVSNTDELLLETREPRRICGVTLKIGMQKET
jgi:hypothetical protein